MFLSSPVWRTGQWIKTWGGLQLGALLAGALLSSGCADEHPSTRILFNNASINGTPARLVLDTGSAYMVIFEDSAKHAGMEIFLRAPPTVDQRFETVTLALAKPARINLGGGDFSVQPLVGNLAKFSIMVAADNARIDGLISWPEVQDNVLIFDGPEHKIQSVKVVPTDAKENWPAFAIGRSEQLTLKTKLANGQLGTLLIDSGAYFGVALPPAQWKEWRAAHPNAPSGYLIYLTPGAIGPQTSEEAWADEIKLGALTLTDVPVHEANESEMTIDPKNYAGTLGLYALARMELVLDGKHGIAYARPRPSPGPYYLGIARAGVEKDADGGPLGKDWTIEGPVTLNPSHIRQMAGGVLLSEATDKYQNGDHAGALAECTQAIEYDDQNDAAFMVRGSLRLAEKEDEGGLADLNHAIELNPSNVWAYTARAKFKLTHNDPGGAIFDCSLALDYDENFAPACFARAVIKQTQNDTPGAIADYDRVCELQPNDSLPQLYREILQRWSGRPPRNLTKNLAGWPNPWHQAIGQYLSGSLSETDLMATAANGSDSAIKTCQANYFTGFVHFLSQDTTGARERWQKCLDSHQTDLYEYIFAQTLVKFLDSMEKK